jgi:hypothetical protein
MFLGDMDRVGGGDENERSLLSLVTYQAPENSTYPSHELNASRGG